MKKVRQDIGLDRLQLNTGQIDWLPANPRTWTQSDVDATRNSILEDEDFLEDRPLLVVPFGKEFVIFAGNIRREGAAAARRISAPCVVYHPENAEDYDTVLRRAMKDNGTYGKTDWHAIYSSKWGTLPLEKWGLKPVGDIGWEKDGLSTEGREGEDGYDEFVDKFKQKLTTDDCYTPPAVYNAIRDFVDKRILPLGKREVVRPFYPGGDYTNLAQYGDGKVVIDNPPFSILAQIIRFFCKNKVPFFIFAPALTLFTAKECDVTYIISDSDIIYENGASVRTGFITNLVAGLRIWCCPELRDAIIAAQPDEDKTKQGFVYPDNIVTAAILGKITKRSVELKIRKMSCEPLSDSDSAKEQGRGL